MNIYVSNISWGLNSDDLRAIFEQHGQVSSANIIKDRETGKSRGFGFVEMDNDNEANSAIEALNGTEHNGKEIAVSVARPREDKPRSGGGGYNRGGGGYGR